MPNYPTYPSQPFTGNLPSAAALGPEDLHPSSGTAPYYQAQIDRRYTRALAGLGSVEVQDEGTDQGYATNELNYIAALDDVQGNGVFDPPGTEPNIHGDAGVFASRYGLPGYMARERMYEPSEVVDATTGRPVVYVNSGAVSLDSAAQVAFTERGLYAPPDPVIRQQQAYNVPDVPTEDVSMPAWPVEGGPTNGLGQDEGWSATKLLLVTGAAAVGMGALYALLKKRGARR